jgi:hypothetical protein
MKRYYPVIRVVGVLVFSFALTLLVPLVFSWYQDDGATTAYDEAFLLTLATGAGLWWATRHEKRNLQIRDGFLLVVLVRTILPVFAALPLVPHLGCSLTAGYFEAVSGLTTTGATILTNFDTLLQSISLWARDAGLAWRDGGDRSRRGHPALARHWRSPDVQGGDPRTDEGLQTDTAHGADGQGIVGGLCRHYRALHTGLPLGRHDMVRRPWCTLSAR